MKLDPNTPWESDYELTNAYNARDAHGLRIINQDAAYRSACERKTALGITHGGLQALPGSQGVNRITGDGREELQALTTHAMQPDESRKALTIAQLERELADLEREASAQETKALAFLRINGSIDRTKPVTPFASRADIVEAMRTPDYRNDPEARAYVHARLEVSTLGTPSEQ
jgi:hypothetical protein